MADKQSGIDKARPLDPEAPVTEPRIVKLSDGRLARIRFEIEVLDGDPYDIPNAPKETVLGPDPYLVRPTQLEKPQKESQKHMPLEYGSHKAVVGPSSDSMSIMDHPIIGGKITIFVLCFGDFPNLARRCIGSILQTVPRDRLDLRVGCNDCSKETIQYLKSVSPTKLYKWSPQIFKYPAMRTMFHDDDCPVTTKYLAWFDDDSFARDPNWLIRLAESIVNNHNKGCRIYGCKYVHPLDIYKKGNHNPKAWFEEASWWRGRFLRVRGRDAEAENGSAIHFVTGGFWALETACMKQADIPDARLKNNGGDIVVSEMVHQAGWRIKDFNRNKCYVLSSGHSRRGVTHKFPWAC